ncbi:hypothetical protein WJX72_000673 [[Myrmecia] bisecta]|uniref:Uncharacterized protein n=1 Tax=[Myrmecia] bisecta TaxID=41462 RepID=A0AAW1QNS3_9CHLO
MRLLGAQRVWHPSARVYVDGGIAAFATGEGKLHRLLPRLLSECIKTNSLRVRAYCWWNLIQSLRSCERKQRKQARRWSP